MSILETLKPTKNVKTFEIHAFEDDMTFFEKAVKALKKQHRGTGEINSETLFEHLIQSLRNDTELSKCIIEPSKRRKKSTSTRVQGDKS